MNVLVDTPVWSLALRRRSAELNPGEQRIVRTWRTLVEKGQAVLMGPIRQEVLSGVRQRTQFARLADRLRDFDDLPLTPAEYELAAEYYNACRSHGVSGSAIDLLICAAASRHLTPIFTTDLDFGRYAKLLPIRLYRQDIPRIGHRP
jgi:predicted nucleic acid-binding protein